jgi:prevent-host-death family protein
MVKTTKAKRDQHSARIVEVAATEFKARCLEFMDCVSKQHQEFVITKRGKRVARLIPVEEKPAKFVGYMKGTILYCGDIVSPVNEKWNADQDE